MGVHFYRLNEKPMRFIAPLEEAEWNEAWGVYFSTIYLTQKIISDCDQEIIIQEEAFKVLLEKDIYESFNNMSEEREYDFYGRLFVTLDADIYLVSDSTMNAYTLGHHLKVLQMVPYGRELLPFIRPEPLAVEPEVLNDHQATTDTDLNFSDRFSRS